LVRADAHCFWNVRGWNGERCSQRGGSEYQRKQEPIDQMESILRRPFYTEFAWAYDLIVAGPISSRCDFMEDVLSQRGVLSGSKILDAGCGTGSYSIELARRGYIVTGLDVSKELISGARKKLGDLSLPLTFEVADIRKLSSAPTFDGILCRGVLNDITDDIRRQEVFFSFARALRKGGVLILDVRQWNSTALTKAKEPIFKKSVETDRGKLTFRSVTQLDDQTRRLLVSERHTLEKDAVESVSEYDFVMRCWTKEELHTHLANTRFGSVVYFGDYDRNIPMGSTDRIVAVASLKR
jgi:2-polyprenyl-3-methyl-5-hydroxy-6-metoxy-1,4-benzoquinol methylase